MKDNNTMFGHPKGLFYLFFAELWERFSFYGMRALLTLYMTKVVFFGDANGEKMSIAVYAAYGALVYSTPLIGGMLADKILGFRKSILIGGILMAIGHFVLAIENNVAFYVALALIIVGNGFFKPNISSFVGALYEQGDSRRDAGFTIFYMGINIGAWLAPLLCGWLAVEYGWHYGFGVAGIGMLAGLVFFWDGLRKEVFGKEGLPPEDSPLDKKVVGLKTEHLIYLGAILCVPIFTMLVWRNGFVSWLLNGALVLSLGYIGYAMTQVSKQEAQRLFVIVLLTIFMTVFWSFFEQGGSSLTLFAEKNVNLIWMNASQTNAINAGFIIIFSIPFSMLWIALSKKKKNPITPIKYALGLAQLGLGFLIFAISIQYADASAKVPMLFLILGYMFVSTGELFLSPVGLSKVTELSPKRFVAFMMGIFFVSSAFAHHIAGIIASFTAVDTEKVAENTQVSDPSFLDNLVQMVTGIEASVGKGFTGAMQSLYTYSSVFAIVGFVAIGFSILAFILTPLMKKWMHGIH